MPPGLGLVSDTDVYECDLTLIDPSLLCEPDLGAIAAIVSTLV